MAEGSDRLYKLMRSTQEAMWHHVHQVSKKALKMALLLLRLPLFFLAWYSFYDTPRAVIENFAEKSILPNSVFDNQKRRCRSTKSILGENIKATEVDYISHDSLVSALRGKDAVVVCGVGMLPQQTNLIDAAIAAGVPRFLPADFAGDLSIPKLRALKVNADKVVTEEYLRARESSISHTSIKTGPLFDLCIERGTLINMKERSITLF
ncbi:MAG: hypothetical protein LQ340_001726 [Diploschistes diacapsis]|nr:MAG: hypothetical protein LQ340_001726 [Diploschistes diacapsis]